MSKHSGLEKDRSALAMARKRWRKKSAHIKQSENRRAYWATISPEVRQARMAHMRACRLSAQSLPGFPDPYLEKF